MLKLRRVLKAGGSLNLLDFAPADTDVGHRHLFHRASEVAERIEGRMTSLMDEAGFVDAAEVKRGKIIIGPIAYYRARNPGPDPA